MIRNKSWMPTSRSVFHLNEPSAEEVYITDIAAALSNLCRFGGHTSQFYSVAQHSLLVMDLLPFDAKPYGLLHDAHEAYIGDMTKPMQDEIYRRTGYRPTKTIAAEIDAVIYEAFGLKQPVHPNIKRLVKEADMVALATEKRDLLEGHDWDWSEPQGGLKLPAPHSRIIAPMMPEQARVKFLMAFEDLCISHPSMAQALESYRQQRARKVSGLSQR